MDQETLTNHISNLGKLAFEAACRIILVDFLRRRCIDVDGPGDGGTDYVEINGDGMRTPIAYQITTQNKNLKDKVNRDAQKIIANYNCDSFLFFTTKKLSALEAHKLGNEISLSLGVPTTIYSSGLIAGLLITENLVTKFLQETHAIEFSDINRNFAEYRQMALYGYTVLSDESRSLKKQIYDDALLITLAEKNEGMTRDELASKAIKLLSLPSIKSGFLMGRIDSLMSRQCIVNNKDLEGFVQLPHKIQEDIQQRQQLYAAEIEGLSRVITDLMKEYGVKWTREDTRKSSIFIAGAYVSKRLEVLKEADASLMISFTELFDQKDLSKFKTYLLKTKKVNAEKLDEIVSKVLDLAANHPLIEKLTRAAVYLGLEGTSPLASSRVIGAYKWSDVNVMIEPTIGIPWLCSDLFNKRNDEQFKNVTYVIERSKKLGAHLRVPFVYLEECAGHLLMARNFDGLDLDENEMQYSRNAFVANYCYLKLKGEPLPNSFLNYLSVFSPAIKVEHADMRTWRREILTTMQSYFNQNGIQFEEIPQYNEQQLGSIMYQYREYLNSKDKIKKPHLLKNDSIVLNYINERISRESEHWMMLTYDRTLIEVSHKIKNLGWVCTPADFIDMTAMTTPNGEEALFSIMHSVASMSERTLSIGARILDNIIMYASNQMREWQFKQEVDRFKEEMVQRVINSENTDYMNFVDKRTEEFLKNHGVKFADDDESVIDIVNLDEEDI